MSTSFLVANKRYLTFPAPEPRASTPRRVVRYLWSLVVLPVALFTAWLRGAPGLGIRIRCIAFGLRALVSGEPRLAFLLIANPMDSFRYFELDFVSRATSQMRADRYLDVSSPRLAPLTIIDRHPGLTVDLLNPIASDLSDTLKLARALAMDNRCRASTRSIEDASYADETFDLISSISVVEHIPDDSQAIARMWRLLKPGGLLLITVPCAREACEEFANLDEYGLLEKDGDGFVYWQRYYNEAELAQRIWSITGRPLRASVYGEAKPGTYDASVLEKRTRAHYPYWWEPVVMARDYRRFDSIGQLVGMGVIAMEFVKPPVVHE